MANLRDERNQPHLAALHRQNADEMQVVFAAIEKRQMQFENSLDQIQNQTLRTLELPASLPVFMGGLRVGATLSVIGAIVGFVVGLVDGTMMAAATAPNTLHPAQFIIFKYVATAGLFALLAVLPWSLRTL